jgi:hypothetical protein
MIFIAFLTPGMGHGLKRAASSILINRQGSEILTGGILENSLPA